MKVLPFHYAVESKKVFGRRTAGLRVISRIF